MALVSDLLERGSFVYKLVVTCRLHRALEQAGAKIAALSTILCSKSRVCSFCSMCLGTFVNDFLRYQVHATPYPARNNAPPYREKAHRSVPRCARAHTHTHTHTCRHTHIYIHLFTYTHSYPQGLPRKHIPVAMQKEMVRKVRVH